MTFIEEMEQSLIPAAERMLKKDIDHQRGLKEQKAKIEKMPWYRRVFHSTDLIETYILSSEVRIESLINRIVEYKEYVKKHKENEKRPSKSNSVH